MNRKRPFTLLALLAGVVLVSGVVVLAAVQQEIGWDVIAGGGGVASAGAVKIADTIGQPIIGPAQSGDVEICSGFWCGGEVATDTPTPTPTTTLTATPTPTPTKTPTPTPTPTFTPTPTATPTGALTCPHDWSEPNDSFATANEITPGHSYVRIYICPSGDEDWFRFDLAMGQVVEIILYNLPADYDLPLRSRRQQGCRIRPNRPGRRDDSLSSLAKRQLSGFGEGTQWCVQRPRLWPAP